ncbi:sugar phosphate isomerase/epimerase family protein [Celeribacter litoreus]|uniref:sugar phosphate isomerase/epimerase family protein n=1 Tax=Celeribacter litoreus TaxID=2876714 RepID=UPI001CCDB1B6|nr:sugar phosphate isomerase/epimerase [Celeribacter litoreus]MCA0044877.1 sugar phosphate isomerase/epimerase [Celeribacter litoreus]
MAHRYSLAFLTTHAVAPDEAVRIAAATGYDLVGLRFLPAAPTEPPYPIMSDPNVEARVKAALDETGIGIADIEIARLKPDTDVESFRDFLALGQRLDAKNVLVAGDDPNHDRITATFTAFCNLAAEYGLTGDLEFMPWTGVKTLREAQAIVEASGCPNAGVLIDGLHWDRAGSTLEDIRNLPPQFIHYAQICDGPKPYDPSDAGLIEIARGARLLPGDGGIDLKGMVRALPADTVLSVEIPQLVKAKTVDAKTRAREALDRTKAMVLESAI